MFESLTERLSGVFGNLGRRGRLRESDVDAALREVRMALLEADVNFRVARDFVASVRERAVGREVTHSVTPAQQVTKIVNDNLVELLGGETARLATAPRPPSVVLMVGLQGSGKTTAAAKLALAFRKDGGRPLLVAADTYRPAAIAQLQTLGKQIDVPVHQQGTDPSPLQIAKRGLELGVSNAHSHVIVDTAGRLQLDDAMMDEVEQISRAIQPVETLFVADATTGQEAVNVARAFHARTPLTGLILTKMDGDARGGAALSIRAVTGIPVKFVGTGERIEPLEVFHPDRIASRILGMGDVVTLVERAEEVVDVERAQELQTKLRKDTFGLDDFLEQLNQVRQMGPLSQVTGHAARHGRHGQPRRGAGRPGRRCGGALRGHHPLDDPRRARQSRRPQRQPSAPRGPRQRHLRSGSQPAAQPVPAGATGHADGQFRPHARRSAQPHRNVKRAITESSLGGRSPRHRRCAAPSPDS